MNALNSGFQLSDTNSITEENFPKGKKNSQGEAAFIFKPVCVESYLFTAQVSLYFRETVEDIRR